MHQERLEKHEALHLLRDAPLIELMARADAVRQRLHPGREVTFVIDTNPNYTNVCVTKCTFCSFYRKPGEAGGYTLQPQEIAAKVARAQALGATTVLLQGGHHPDLPFDYYLHLIESIQEAAPGIHLHLFSPAEIDHMAQVSSKSSHDVLETFWNLGVRTMPGGGAEILVDRVRRQISPKKISAQTWLDVMRVAHEIGMKTSATMTYGHVETEEDIVEHLLRLRELQDETGGFYAFIPWSYKPGAAPLSRRVPEVAPPSYYARIIALSRLFLDNFPHIQASWFGEGWRAGQIALHAGADDFGGLLLEENVLYQAQHNVATNLEAVLNTITEAEFVPVQRTTLYAKIQRYDAVEAAITPVVQQRRPGLETHARAAC
jgi:cyclic dehypoxanthinyl futalosine synthase